MSASSAIHLTHAWQLPLAFAVWSHGGLHLNWVMCSSFSCGWHLLSEMRAKVVSTSWGFQEFGAWVLCFQLVCRTFLTLAKEQIFSNRGSWFLGMKASISPRPTKATIALFWLIWLPISKHIKLSHISQIKAYNCTIFSHPSIPGPEEHSYEAWCCYVKSKFSSLNPLNLHMLAFFLNPSSCCMATALLLQFCHAILMER